MEEKDFLKFWGKYENWQMGRIMERTNGRANPEIAKRVILNDFIREINEKLENKSNRQGY